VFLDGADVRLPDRAVPLDAGALLTANGEVS
jgi:hypothetical protein